MRVTRALAVALAACSAPALLPDLDRARTAERRGDDQAALAAYDRALTTCQRADDPARSCADAHTWRAELLDRMGRRAEAAQAYEAIPAVLPGDDVAGSRATYRAGKLHLALGDERRAYELLWRTVTDYPDQAFAADALKVVVRDGRTRDPRALYDALAGLVDPLSETRIADNLLYALAEIAEHDFDDTRLARGYLDTIPERYPDSGLRDEAWWHGARLARAAGDGAGAATRLRALLATREVTIGVGSYFSVWLDDAQLELGRILRDDLGDAAAATAAFRELPEDYPDSILRDDALWELARTHAGAGDRRAACARLAELARAWPDSKHQLTRAPALARDLGCPAVAGRGTP